jgi:hypothetical protein
VRKRFGKRSLGIPGEGSRKILSRNLGSEGGLTASARGAGGGFVTYSVELQSTAAC